MTSHLKSLRIQTGVLQRLNNELRYYSKEAESLKSKYDNLRSSNSASSKQAFEVWQDAQKVLPQVVLQLQLAYKELQLILSSNFSALHVSADDASPEVVAVLLARTQLQRSLDVIPSLESEASKNSQPIVTSRDEEYFFYCVEISFMQFDRKLSQIALLVKKHKLHKIHKLPPILPIPAGPPSDPIDPLGTNLINPIEPYSLGTQHCKRIEANKTNKPIEANNSTYVLDRGSGPESKGERFYCYECLGPSEGEAAWTDESKQFCSWECQLNHQSHLATLRKRRSELMLLQLNEDLADKESETLSPGISPLHELTILRIK